MDYIIIIIIIIIRQICGQTSSPDKFALITILQRKKKSLIYCVHQLLKNKQTGIGVMKTRNPEKLDASAQDLLQFHVGVCHISSFYVY